MASPTISQLFRVLAAHPKEHYYELVTFKVRCISINVRNFAHNRDTW
jgi:hypothetical protein